MRLIPIVILVRLTTMLADTVLGSPSKSSNDAPFWTGNPNASTFEKLMNERLASAQAALDRLLAVKGKRTIENTLATYDEILTQLDSAGAQAALMEVVHPDKSIRDAAEKVTQNVSSFNTELS